MTIETAIKSLKEARRSLIDAKNGVVERAVFPWREDEMVDPTPDYDDMIRDIELNIISIERQAYRDPEQDMEMRMELEAEMRMSGVRDDPHLYMHTPFEEELFQEDIQRQINYGYYDSDGGWNDGLYDDRDLPGKCATCNQGNVWSDEVLFVHGHATCEQCFEDVLQFAAFLSCVCNLELREDKYGEWTLIDDEGDIA